MKHALLSLLLFLSAGNLVASPPVVPPLNFLIIMADDCTFNDLPLYDGQNAKTPNIDRLAAQGLTFNRAYLSEAMCQPCRAELYSGQFPLRNGCAWNHSSSRPTTKSLPHFLQPLGYRVGLAGKGHVKPQPAFPFTKVDGFDPNCVRNPTQAHDLAAMKEFISKEHTSPFCLVVALVEPHVPWVMGDPSQYPPKKIRLPANIADTPRTRQDFGKYLAEITYMDGQVGELLRALDDAGRTKDTLVLFTSEQGSQFPGCKWTNWDTGIHTALIARLPGQITAGKRTDAIVQYADVAPTLIEAAGGKTAGWKFDGSSFLSVLRGKTQQHREYAYGIHNNLPEGPAYPIRTVTDGRYRYILNLRPDELYIEKHLMGQRGNGSLNNPYWGTWIFETHNRPKTYHLVKRYMQRPREQLYLTETDPYEMQNLAGNPAHAKAKKRLSAELDRWMQSQGDPGIPQDTLKALEAARRGKHLYVPPTD
ncbi:MAG: sulfatase-like hydrolase/transferase [Limisphaerales bacterium]